MSIRLAVMRIKTPWIIAKLHHRLFAFTGGWWNDFFLSSRAATTK